MAEFLLRSGFFVVALCGIAARAEASAAPHRWTVHVGATVTRLADIASIRIAGIRDPDASVSTRVTAEPTIDVIRHLDDHFAVAISGGLPLAATFRGRGSLEPLGNLVRSRAGAATVSLQFGKTVGAVRPYVGVGAAVLHVFRTTGIAVQNAKATDDLGPMVQAGVDVSLIPHAGVFVEVKQDWLVSRLTGSVGGTPAESRLKLNPLTLTVGLSANF